MGTVQFSATGVAEWLPEWIIKLFMAPITLPPLLKKPAICAGKVTLVPCTHKESAQAKCKSVVLATWFILGTCVNECQLTSLRLVLQVSDRVIDCLIVIIIIGPLFPLSAKNLRIVVVREDHL